MTSPPAGRPAYPHGPSPVVPTGETLMEALDAMGISAAELCARSGLSEREVAGIIHGVARLTSETALALEGVTGVAASEWEARERCYRAALAPYVARPAG